jgi:hypothetical protein
MPAYISCNRRRFAPIRAGGIAANSRTVYDIQIP